MAAGTGIVLPCLGREAGRISRLRDSCPLAALWLLGEVLDSLLGGKQACPTVGMGAVLSLAVAPASASFNTALTPC